MITEHPYKRMNQSIFVVVDRRSAYYNDYEKLLQPLLKNSGFCFQVITEDSFESLALYDYSCIIFAHKGIIISNELVQSIINHCSKCGAGVISFSNEIEFSDSSDENSLSSEVFCIEREDLENKITILDGSHYITAMHSMNEQFAVTSESSNYIMRYLSEERFIYNTALASFGDRPIIVIQYNKGVRIVRFSVPNIFSSSLNGIMFMIDDILKRSVIWAARKPLVLKHMKNFAGFRVDDCCGDHGYYKNNPFGWIEIANKYGFKPWVGFFWEEISDESLKILSRYVKESKATAQFHGMYLMGKTFFNLDVRKSGVADFVRNWLKSRNSDITLSCYLVPHSYDLTSSSLEGFKELGVKVIGTPYPFDTSGAAAKNTSNWLCAGPYRMYDKGKDNNPWDLHQKGTPFYYADWLRDENGEKVIFNTLTELRDVNGYEWFSFSNAPEQYEDVKSAIRKGTEIFKRCFDSDIMPVLFTHEDAWREMFLSKIKPDILDRIFAGISLNIARYSPSYNTLDESVKYVLDYNETDIIASYYDTENDRMNVVLNGKSENGINLCIYYDDSDNISQLMTKPVIFSDEKEYEFILKKDVSAEKSTVFGSEMPVEYMTFNSTKNIGTILTILSYGYITGVRCYFKKSDSGVHSVSICNYESGEFIFIDENWELDVLEEGWYVYKLDEPLYVECGQRIIVYVSTLKSDCKVYGTAFSYCGHMYPIDNGRVRCEGMAGVIADDDFNAKINISDDAFFRDIEFVTNPKEVRQ